DRVHAEERRAPPAAPARGKPAAGSGRDRSRPARRALRPNRHTLNLAGRCTGGCPCRAAVPMLVVGTVGGTRPTRKKNQREETMTSLRLAALSLLAAAFSPAALAQA